MFEITLIYTWIVLILLGFNLRIPCGLPQGILKLK